MSTETHGCIGRSTSLNPAFREGHTVFLGQHQVTNWSRLFLPTLWTVCPFWWNSSYAAVLSAIPTKPASSTAFLSLATVAISSFPKEKFKDQKNFTFFAFCFLNVWICALREVLMSSDFLYRKEICSMHLLTTDLLWLAFIRSSAWWTGKQAYLTFICFWISLKFFKCLWWA